jgi:hypothetical protein
MSKQGFLAIWCEIGSEDLVDYHNWQTQEHIADRIYSPGFLGMRLFTNVENPCAHFFLYATENPGVLSSPSYLKILDNPTPWTKRLMPKFGPFDRAAGTKVVKIGRGHGSHVLASRVKTDGSALNATSAKEALQQFIHLPDAMGARLLATDRSTTGIKSEEKKMRGNIEGDFDYLLIVEALSRGGAEWARDQLATALAPAISGLKEFDAMVCQMIYGEAPHEGELPAR